MSTLPTLLESDSPGATVARDIIESPDSPGGGKAQDRRWTFVALTAAIPVLLVAFGALAARPVGDDYWFEGNLTSEGDPVGAFSLGIRTWSAFYTMYAALTAGVAAGRVAGVEVYYPLASLLVLVLFLGSCRTLVRLWFRELHVSAPVLPAALLLFTAVVASLATFRYPAAPTLFGALYWQSASVPHIVPMLALPTVLAVCLRTRPGRSKPFRPECLIAGVLLAGFSFGPASVAVIMAAVFWWAVRRLRGAEASKRALPGAANFAVGVAAGTVLVFALPGTSVRQAAISAHRGEAGILSSETWGGLTSTAWEVATSSLLTPAIVVGFLAGFLLRRLASPSVPVSAELHAVRTVRRALGVGLVCSWIPISIGSYASYLGFWHWWPLMLIWTVLCATAGWGLAAGGATRPAPSTADRRSPLLFRGAGATSVALAVVVLWGSLAAGFAASAVWQRRPSFDRNVESARAALDSDPDGTIEWISSSLPYLGDVEAGAHDAWANQAVARWLGVDPEALTVVSVEVTGATVPVLSTLPPFLAASP